MQLRHESKRIPTSIPLRSPAFVRHVLTDLWLPRAICFCEISGLKARRIKCFVFIVIVSVLKMHQIYSKRRQKCIVSIDRHGFEACPLPLPFPFEHGLWMCVRSACLIFLKRIMTRVALQIKKTQGTKTHLPCESHGLVEANVSWKRTEAFMRRAKATLVWSSYGLQ